MKTSTKTNPEPTTNRKRILLVDDHPAVREGLTTVINQTPDLIICGTAASPAEALAAITKLKPDAALVDLSLQDGNGLELIKDIRSYYGDKLPTIVLSMYDEMLYADRALRAGALGYIMKSEPMQVVIEGLRRVLRGEVCVSSQLNSRILGSYVTKKEPKLRSPIELLSDRELEVFELIGQGLSTREAAGKLHLSMKTVSCYRENIKNKLGLRHTAELLRHAVHWNEQAGSKAAVSTKGAA